ncbi:hypothetical protein F7725_013232 [Dissostichus mawsoni]|uniref:Annexin n=1 Tax=Dissostichus mawsoni TaxID=36200 RepID=A0A7J5YPZ3_DISMA|nr:hypothetical protein F7725_013232 [Dissostichus mawsoni]
MSEQSLKVCTEWAWPGDFNWLFQVPQGESRCCGEKLFRFKTQIQDDLDSLVNSPSSFEAATGERGTIKPKADFDAGDDAVALRKAIEGLGTKDKVLIDILTHRSSAQRQLICEAYLGATGRTLVEDLKGDTSGDFEELLVALATPPAVYDCHEVMRAMEGAGTKDSVLIEIFASRSNQQIKALSDVYLEETEKKLTLDLKSEISGDFANALLLLAENISGKTLQHSIEGEMSGDLEELLVAIGGGGTDESTLNRIMVGRSEIDMLDIRAEFKKLYEYSLHSAIEILNFQLQTTNL